MAGQTRLGDPPRDVRQLLQRARDAAVATDGDGRIVSWNEAAEVLLEDREGTLMQPGRPLHSALEAHDVFGNRLCPRGTPLRAMLEEGEGIQGFEMDVRTAAGDRVRVGVSVVVVLGPEPEDVHMVHLLRLRQRRRRTDQLLDRMLRERGPRDPETGEGGKRAAACERSSSAQEKLLDRLTPREQEVLDHLVDGESTDEIAEELGISVHTVRRHCQNLMRKLGIHSKVEAVALALRASLR